MKWDMPTLTNCINDVQVLRRRVMLEPEGGPDSKFYPPTYEGAKYSFETRFEDGKEIKCCLIDSVASQGNRVDLGLIDAVEEGDIFIPHFVMDTRNLMVKFDSMTSLELSHGVVDAILRDSLVDGVPFMDTKFWKILTRFSDRNATEMFGMSLYDLVRGLMATSTIGRCGELSIANARTLTSEIVAFNAVAGNDVQSKMDAFRIGTVGGPLYLNENGMWTLDAARAKISQKKKSASKSEDEGDDNKNDKKPKVDVDGKRGFDPSAAMYGAIPPSPREHGGITAESIRWFTSISIARTREYRFPINGTMDKEVNRIARATIVALAVLGATKARYRTYLRSRCTLVAKSKPLEWEILDCDGNSDKMIIDDNAAVDVYNECVQQAKSIGLPWNDTPVQVSATPDLTEMIRKSRDARKE